MKSICSLFVLCVLSSCLCLSVSLYGRPVALDTYYGSKNPEQSKHIDSNTLRDGKSQRALERTIMQPWVDPFHSVRRTKASGLANRTAFSSRTPVIVNWTGQNMRRLEKRRRGESDLHSPLARLPCLVARRGRLRRTEARVRLLCMHC